MPLVWSSHQVHDNGDGGGGAGGSERSTIMIRMVIAPGFRIGSLPGLVPTIW